MVCFGLGFGCGLVFMFCGLCLFELGGSVLLFVVWDCGLILFVMVGCLGLVLFVDC